MNRVYSVIIIIIPFLFLNSCRQDIVEFSLDSDEGSLYIDSSPQYARIYLRGEYSGKHTPEWLSQLEKGNYRITLKLNGYVDTTFRVDVEGAKRKYLLVTMQKIESR